MGRFNIKNAVIVVLVSIFASSCGVSDYINRKKITKATKPEPDKQVQVEARQSSKCEDNESRINRMVKYINQARSEKRSCGDKIYPPAQAVSWNSRLYSAANTHSRDMATHNLFSHIGSDNSTTEARISASGYDWKAVAENISGGTVTPEQTIDRWLASQGHCHNIMNPVYTEIGMACVVSGTSEFEIYWTLVLARAQP